MKELQKADILKYFEEINCIMASKNKYGVILIVGGAALTLVHDARSATFDIDALFQPTEDMRKIASQIAERYNLNEGWLNDGVKGFVTPQMQSKQELFKEYSNLMVYTLSEECLLAMKLTAARTLTKDMDDSIFLMKKLNIKSLDELEAIVEEYTDKNRQTASSWYFMKEAFDKYSRIVIEPPKKQHEQESILAQIRNYNQTRRDHNIKNPPGKDRRKNKDDQYER